MGIDLKKLDATKIETALYNLIRPLFTEVDVYVMGGSRNMDENPERQIYCNAPIDIKNLNAHGKTITRIEIYVRKLKGVKNGAELTRIRDIVLDKLQDGITINGYRFSHTDEITGDDRADFNYIFINLATLIV